MSQKQCNTCRGVYESEQPDGTDYFHACPDTVKPEDRRNENVKSTRSADAKSIKQPGKGSSLK